MSSSSDHSTTRISLILTSLAVMWSSAPLLAQQNNDDVQVEVLTVRDNIFMLTGAGGNVSVQTGDQGVLVIDTQFAYMSEKLLEKISQLSDGPLRYIINTHHHGDHVGGNANIRAHGITLAGGNIADDNNDAAISVPIVAHENVLLNMTASLGEEGGPTVADLPTSTYFTEYMDISFNNERVRILHQPDAHTNGDSIIHFSKSDVIVTGDVYWTTMYPFLDSSSQGSIQGVIAAANKIIELMTAEDGQQGNTLVIPGHGRISELQDVISWREMLTVIRDRIQDMINRGMTLEEVKTASPTMDYDERWGANASFWTTEQFVETVYQNLSR